MIWIVVAGVVLLLGIGPLLVPRTVSRSLPKAHDLAGEQSLFLDIHGVAVHYRELPATSQETEENATSFLLIHGFGLSMSSFRHIVPALRAFGRVVMFDRPGFGLSDRLEGGSLTKYNPYRPEAQRQMIVQIMDALDIKRAVIVAHSGGCSVAVETAFANPERIDGLVLISPTLYRTSSLPALVRTLLRVPQLSHIGAAITRSAFERLVSPPDSHSPPRFLQNSWYDPTKADAETFADTAQTIAVRNWDISLWEMTLASSKTASVQHVRQLLLPVLVMAGDNDRITPVKDHERLAQELPGSRLVVIAHSGHSPHEEQPEETSRVLKAFIRERLAEFFPT